MPHTNKRYQDRAKTKAIDPKHQNVMMGILLLCAVSILVLASGTRIALSAQYPDCNAVPVEFRIIREFNWAERKNWQRGIEMVRFSKAHEHRTVQYSGSEVSRRYCMAKAHFSNGQKRTIYYMISDTGGFVGLNWDVTHCVIGLDPWRNHDGNCRAIR